MSLFGNKPTDKFLSDLARALSQPSPEDRKRAAWATTRPIEGPMRATFPHDAAYDELGNVVCYSAYGDHGSVYGWDIDHRQPKAVGGSDSLHNLRALRCSVNRGLGGILGLLLKQQ